MRAAISCVVNRYGDWLAVQFLTQGVERWRAEIVSALVSLVTPKGVYERSDVDVREREGLPQRRGLVWGEEPPEQIDDEDRVELASEFVGLANFRALFNDPGYIDSFWTTAVFSVMVAGFGIAISLLLHTVELHPGEVREVAHDFGSDLRHALHPTSRARLARRAQAPRMPCAALASSLAASPAERSTAVTRSPSSMARWRPAGYGKRGRSSFSTSAGAPRK